MNQTNFLAELHTRTDEQAALEEQANEEFHENMQRHVRSPLLVDQWQTCAVCDKEKPSVLPGKHKLFGIL